MATAEWIDRLRSGSYESPNGVVSNFKFDALSRSGGKKASVHELLNSDNAIVQDQGNTIDNYPMNIYFVDDDGDTEADTFVASLKENYSPDSPGVLKHPRWGDISVIPFSFEQNENYVSGAGIFRVTVEFKEVNISAYPGITGDNEANIISSIDTLESSIDTANESIDVNDTTRYAKFKSTITSALDVIVDNVASVAKLVDDTYDDFILIKEDIAYALSIGTSAVEIMSQVNSILRLATNVTSLLDTDTTNILANVSTSTLASVQSYTDMLPDLITTFTGKVNAQTNRTDQLNNAIMLQSISSMATACIVESALYTTIDTRDTASDIIDFITDGADQVEVAVSGVYQTLSDTYVTKTFIPDHDTGLYLSEIVGQSESYLIDKSFSLKIKQTTILTAPKDALTLAWELYGDISKLEFLILTNKLNDNEIIECSVGREIVSYA